MVSATFDCGYEQAVFRRFSDCQQDDMVWKGAVCDWQELIRFWWWSVHHVALGLGQDYGYSCLG